MKCDQTEGCVVAGQRNYVLTKATFELESQNLKIYMEKSTNQLIVCTAGMFVIETAVLVGIVQFLFSINLN